MNSLFNKLANKLPRLSSTLTMLIFLICATASLSAYAQKNSNQLVHNQKILFVISSDKMGYWLPEVVEPYQVLSKSGFIIDIASPKGDKGVQRGAGRMSENLKEWLAKSKLNMQLKHPLVLQTIDTKQYQAVYFAGGAGPMFDFLDNAEVHRVVREIYEAGGLVAADCHGPAALINSHLSDGSLLIKGKKLTAKANIEEGWWAKANYPYLLEDKIKALGGNFSAAGKGEPHVVIDGQLITGQNPASAVPVAKAILAALK